MNVQIGSGTLTTEHPESSGQPVFVFNGVTYRSDEKIDLGPEAFDFLRYPVASRHVEAAYFLGVGKNSDTTLDEYNMIAQFANLRLAPIL